MDAVLSVFTQLEGLMGELYPYRYVITPLLLLAGATVLFLAYRGGLHRLLLRHRVATVLLGVPLLVVAIVAGNYLLSPLWERSFLEEMSPVEAAAMPVVPAPSAAPAGAMPAPAASAMVTHRGTFRGADDFHFGRGTAQLIRTAEGKLVLRFEDFSVRNGPDLFVYLSRDESGRRVEEALNLGALKATDGAFNYEIPSHIDIATVKSAVVWCRQFAVLFAVAPLMPA